MAGPSTGLRGTGLWAPALAGWLGRQAAHEWFATPFGAAQIAGPKVTGFAAAPRDLRPADETIGRDLLDGAFVLGGESLQVGPGGDPWNRPSPSRRFAVLLHRMDWLGDLLSTGEPGAREALRLCLEWRRVFGRWNGFAWGPEVLDRRAFNLACAARVMAAHASDFETQTLADSLARQARHLLRLGDKPPRAAERRAAAAIAGAALNGQAGERLMAQACTQLEADLEVAVLADGGHATRSPQAAMELLFDLLTLDDALIQRGRPPMEGLSRAIDRLTAGLRFFTLNDGRLAALQGGESSEPRRIAAARAHDDAPPEARPAPREAPYAGYQRMTGRGLDIIADAAPPASGAWSTGALGQPMAIEVVCGRDRLISGSGWSEIAAGPQALRLASGGSTVAIGSGVVGEPLSGFSARVLGARLVGGVAKVTVARRESEAGVWLDMAHDGWLARYGLTHERRLFLDRVHDELRGEDRFVPGEAAKANTVPIAVHFHLHPDVRASLARDQRSVLLKGASNIGWWLRNDAGEVSLEPSVHFHGGRAQRTTQVVLRGRLRADRGGRVRWKLAMAEGA
jgi:uncharacterized heparinase superfamily protein